MFVVNLRKVKCDPHMRTKPCRVSTCLGSGSANLTTTYRCGTIVGFTAPYNYNRHGVGGGYSYSLPPQTLTVGLDLPSMKERRVKVRHDGPRKRGGGVTKEGIKIRNDGLRDEGRNYYI